MNRIRLQYLDANPWDRSAQGEVLPREEQDEGADDEEDEGNSTGDEGDDDQEDNDGYSVMLYRAYPR